MDPWRSLSAEFAKVVKRVEALERRSPFTNTGIAILPVLGGQRVTISDSGGADLLREDDGGLGAAWPLAPVPFAGISWPTWDSNSSASFTSVASAFSLKSSPQLLVTVRAICDGSAAGEVRLVCNGVQLGAAGVPNLSMTTATFGPSTPDGAIGSDLDLQVDTRVTSGAGRCYARVVAAQQWPST